MGVARKECEGCDFGAFSVYFGRISVHFYAFYNRSALVNFGTGFESENHLNFPMLASMFPRFLVWRWEFAYYKSVSCCDANRLHM